jgi:hypothetical protein
MNTSIPEGFRRIWGTMPQDPQIFAEHNTHEAFAKYAVGAVSGHEAESTADYIADLRSRSDLDLDAVNDLLRQAGSQFYFLDRDQLMELFAAIEAELRKK